MNKFTKALMVAVAGITLGVSAHITTAHAQDYQEVVKLTYKDPSTTKPIKALKFDNKTIYAFKTAKVAYYYQSQTARYLKAYVVITDGYADFVPAYNYTVDKFTGKKYLGEQVGKNYPDKPTPFDPNAPLQPVQDNLNHSYTLSNLYDSTGVKTDLNFYNDEVSTISYDAHPTHNYVPVWSEYWAHHTDDVNA
ncbi:MAG: hypothetical protein LBT80_01580 [Lactobacillaceae bacterium]|jgi:hypothetical protein|nr:hypothetical protein [Lactobacillaceae bacterium]